MLLGAVVAGHIGDIPDDLVPDVHRLIDQIDRDRRVVQPRLHHRFQVDRHGLALSTHRLIGNGEEISFDFHTTGTGIAQVLGAIYAWVCGGTVCAILAAIASSGIAGFGVVCGTNIVPPSCSSWLCQQTRVPIIGTRVANLLLIDIALLFAVLVACAGR